MKIKNLASMLLLFMASAAFAQSNQTPINIAVLTAQPSPTQFTNFSSLNGTYTFGTQNTTNSNFCVNGADLCTASISPVDVYPSTIANTRWGTYKLNNPDAKSCSPSILFGGLQYCLLEFHFHAPSEHFVMNSATDMEVHFVFFKYIDVVPAPNTNGTICNSDSLLVLGLRMVGGRGTNAAWTSIFNSIPAVNPIGSPSGSTVSFNIADLMGIPNINTAPSFRYSGGLTAPISRGALGIAGYPNIMGSTCLNDQIPGAAWGNPQNQLYLGRMPKIVSWVLFKQPVYLSNAQVQQFKTAFPDGNARAVQPVNVTVYYANPN
jgi:carbonic anhydrase